MSHSMKISYLNKIHFSLDPLKERSTEYLVAEQRAFWQKKKSPQGLGQASSTILLAKGCQYNAGPDRGLSFSQRMLFQGQGYLGLGLGLGLVSTLALTLKQHSLKKDGRSPTPCFTDTLRKPRHGFLSVRSLESWNRCTCILCMWLPFLIGQGTGLSLTS